MAGAPGAAMKGGKAGEMIRPDEAGAPRHAIQGWIIGHG